MLQMLRKNYSLIFPPLWCSSIHLSELVYCRNGVRRCGCYCVISLAWEKLREEGVIDVFHSVKMVKMNRPQLVANVVGVQ